MPVRHGLKVVVGFLLFWGAITLLFDGLHVAALVRGMRAVGYPSVEGTVQSSLVGVRSDSEGCTYAPEVKYRYVVGGAEYVGHRVGHGASSAGRKWAERQVSAFPAGAKVRVFYNPRDPSDAVLRAGPDPMTVFGFIFMMPFNVVLVIGIGLLVEAVRYQRERPRAGGMLVVEEGEVVRVRVKRARLLMGMLGMMGVAAFVAVFAVMFGTEMDPSMEVVSWTLAGVVAIGVATGVVSWVRRESRERFVTIGGRPAVVGLPRMRVPVSVREEEIPVEQVVDVRYRDVGSGESTMMVLSFFVEDGKGVRREVNLGTGIGLGNERGEALAEFLRERIRECGKR